jgi:hypothetical protein
MSSTLLALRKNRTVLTALCLVAACSVKGAANDGDDDETKGAATTGDTGDTFDPDGSTGPGGTTCDAAPGDDQDGDGFRGEDGDCNDCDANVGPASVEVVTDSTDPQAVAADEDCDGQVDEPRESCDSGLALNDMDADDAAKALELCERADSNGFGVVSAAFVRANGAPLAGGNLHIGMQSGFGPNVLPRAGASMLSMSSGNARIPGQPDACGSVSCGSLGAGTAPPGYPQDGANCMGGPDINDDVGLEVQLRAPANATGFSYEFSFFSHEYPEWVCTTFNDQYIALVSPPPDGAINGNISFDSQHNPVSVNIALFNVCAGCSAGTGELEGTGFDIWGYDGINDAGATGWLVTTAPIAPGEQVSVRFAIWDTGDTAYDSTVLIDNFTWLADGGTVPVGTQPVPE